MVRNWLFLKCAVTAVLLTQGPNAALAADDVELEALFEGLRGGDAHAAQQIEGRIAEIWSQSGSEAMDLLLDRGREALDQGNTTLAIWHFTALIDHAPDFAEGYNGRATAYFHAGQYGLSLADIQRTLDLNPRHFGAMSGLALILEDIGKIEDALAMWREVEKINPHREGLAEAVLRLENQVEGEQL
jgi:tetratricopeptide (TPR) repeat protein